MNVCSCCSRSQAFGDAIKKACNKKGEFRTVTKLCEMNEAQHESKKGETELLRLQVLQAAVEKAQADEAKRAEAAALAAAMKAAMAAAASSSRVL